MKQASNPGFKFRLPIAYKLVFLTVTLLFVACFWIGSQNAKVLGFFAQRFYEGATKDLADSRARNLENLFDGYRARIKIIGSLLYKMSLKNLGQPLTDEDLETLRTTFDEDKDLVTIELWNKKEDGSVAFMNRRVNSEYLKSYQTQDDYIEKVVRTLPWFQKSLSGIFATGNIEVRNASIPNGAPLVTFFMPLARNDATGAITHVVVADIRQDRVQKMASKPGDVTTVYVVDQDGTILAHPEDQRAVKSEKGDAESNEMLSLLLNEKRGELSLQTKVQIDNVPFIAAFKRTAYGPVVLAETPEAVITEPSRNLRRDVFVFLGFILAGAFFLMVVFSISLTRPIEKLAAITKQVAAGNFEVKSNIHTGDEVEELSQAFDGMIDGLKERDKIKNVMVKFHGSTVTDTLLTGDIALGGSLREVTVLFSDVRDFTKFSEGHSPQHVVEMLNEYFQIMVRIINVNHGVVDKFIGDAIMAIWGAPKSTGQDTVCAVTAALQMRAALSELNERRIARGEVPIKIGVGIHTGQAIAGQIGSDERMEYTVIGDTVNQSSRIESSTKAFGTDLLVSEEAQNIIKEKFIVDYAGAAEVKGKAEPLKLFKVQGYIDEAGNPVVIRTPYSEYEAGDADKVKVA